MSVRSKVAAVAAPEAAAARHAIPEHKHYPRRGNDPRVSAPGSKAAQQRQAIEDIKARRPAEPEGPSSPPAPPASDSTADALTPSHTGGGVVLGVVGVVLLRAYLTGGGAGVKRLLNAKLFNKVTTGAGK